MEYILIVILAVSAYVDSSSIESFSSATKSFDQKRSDESEPWKIHILPNTIEPILYSLTISPNMILSSSAFLGHVSIEMNVLNRTNYIVVHMRHLDIKWHRIYSNGKLVKNTTRFEYAKNDYWVFQAFETLHGKAKLEVSYSGTMTTVTQPFVDPSGLYKIPYLNSATGKQRLVKDTQVRWVAVHHFLQIVIEFIKMERNRSFLRRNILPI